jgi:hypothetical protein
VIVSHDRKTRGLWLGLALVALSFAPAPPKNEPDLRAMAEARYEKALKQFEETWVYYRQARVEVYSVYAWSRIVLDAQQELSNRRVDVLASLEAHKGRMERLEALVKKVRKLGFGQALEVGASEYYRQEAEYFLERAKAQ